ncbi:hypothetical protein D9758_007333 [Tetrapyrgos nigripes]|uniref:F-box domain-containing protein n=1 Tax=Tetrapyrgos nigripes TaxID=182062 RepID=A0A8H5LLN5_9AGAR|nr:hypothetical protein D9758_007333 [Tetrapyrgos nigripes]
MSALLQDVLRSHSADSKTIERKLKSLNVQTRNHTTNANSNNGDDSDDSDELVNVVSIPGTPSRTRPSSPTRTGGAASRPIRGPLHISSQPTRDPLKLLPTEISQKIFSRLSIRDLAKCALVSKKWSRSQTINYVWFQVYRKDNFRDDSLPPGKWTKRESKQNWRISHLKSVSERSPTTTGTNGYTPSRGSGYTSPSTASGYQTPREIREERWRQEAEATSSPGKVEMRAMYKELGGRKSKAKTKLGSTGVRDKGGWAEERDMW